MDAQQAIEAPRFLIGGGRAADRTCRSRIAFRASILADLEARGHTFKKVGRKGEVKYGYAAVAVVHRGEGHGRSAAPSRADRTGP